MRTDLPELKCHRQRAVTQSVVDGYPMSMAPMTSSNRAAILSNHAGSSSANAARTCARRQRRCCVEGVRRCVRGATGRHKPPVAPPRVQPERPRGVLRSALLELACGDRKTEFHVPEPWEEPIGGPRRHPAPGRSEADGLGLLASHPTSLRTLPMTKSENLSVAKQSSASVRITTNQRKQN